MIIATRPLRWFASFATVALALVATIVAGCGKESASPPPTAEAPPSASSGTSPASEAEFRAERIHPWRIPQDWSPDEFTPNRPEEEVILLDGRRFRASPIGESGGVSRWKTASGEVTFLASDVDRNAAAREAWARVRKFETLQDPDLVAELQLRVKEIAARKARSEDPLADAQASLARLRQAKDADGLLALAAGLDARYDGPWPWDRAPARALATEAYRELSGCCGPADDRNPNFRAGWAAAKAWRLRHDAKDRDFALRALNGAFVDDAFHRAERVRSLEAEEFYARHISGYIKEWDRTGTDWQGGEPAPRKFRVHRFDGTVLVEPNPPPTPEGVSAVWKAKVVEFTDPSVIFVGGSNAGQFSSSTDPVWWLLRWDPVKKSWEEKSPLQALYEARSRVHAFLAEMVTVELEAVGEAYGAIRRHHDALDEMAELMVSSAGVEQKKKEMEEGRVRVNEALDAAAAATEKSLRCRAVMERGFARLRRMDSWLDRLLTGEAVDLSPAAEASEVFLRGDKADPKTKERLYAALCEFEPNVRRKVLDEVGFPAYMKDPEIRGLLLELVKCDVAPQYERILAAQLLKDAGDPVGEGFFKAGGH